MDGSKRWSVVLEGGADAPAALSVWIGVRFLELDRHRAGELALRMRTGRTFSCGDWTREVAEARAALIERAWGANGADGTARAVERRGEDGR